MTTESEQVLPDPADGVVIRPYKADDLPTVMELANLAWQPIYDSYRKLMGDELFWHLYQDRLTRKGAELKTMLERGKVGAYVAEQAGRVAGFVTFLLHRQQKTGEIEANAVDSRLGLKGVGQRMYAKVLEHFRSEGMLYARVHTGLDEGHARARRAYEKSGFDIMTDWRIYYKKL